MKIYIIPIEEKFRPEGQNFKYPAHNSDYGVEQDFYKYINKKEEILVDIPENADWHYLPIFWTRWHLNHNYGRGGLKDLQEEASKKIIDDSKTFTICQYDDGPMINIEKTIQFLASRKSEIGIDIPLLSLPHRLPLFTPSKKYMASFIGRLSTHKIRKKMEEELSKIKDILIADGNLGSDYFVKNTLRSHISLCPRGYGGSSFRFFESMQLGVVPFLIGDLDTRPFKKFIDWDKISFYANDPSELKNFFDTLNEKKIIEMGKSAKVIYENYLQYQKWCNYVLKELEAFKK